jgi:hypothetical protein
MTSEQVISSMLAGIWSRIEVGISEIRVRCIYRRANLLGWVHFMLYHFSYLTSDCWMLDFEDGSFPIPYAGSELLRGY